MDKPGQPAQATDVSVVRVRAQAYQAQVEAFGEAAARYQLELGTQVSGRILSLNEAFESGSRIDRDEVLLQLDQSSYKAALAGAEQALADARLALLEEQRQGLQAEAEWRSSGLSGTPDSPLVLRKPQLASAKAAVTAAQATLASARNDLNQTRLKAPFDALIIERLVAPGDYLQAGTQVATLYSTDRIEIRLAVSARGWLNLPSDDLLTAGDWPVALRDVENGQGWNGRVIRVESHRNETTRQRVLVVAVDQPLDQQPPLLPGTFVKAKIAGGERDQLWKLPITALSQRGEIWYVDSTNKLAKLAVTPAFSDAESIYIPVPSQFQSSTFQVLEHPLNGYLEGMKVNPIEERSDA
jgi:RND family efflux transporter MFP subunit